MAEKVWPKIMTVELDRTELDYIVEALEMLANYHDAKLSDSVSDKLITAWNEGAVYHDKQYRRKETNER